jgi:membrane protein DedA with SNARE-associated domain
MKHAILTLALAGMLAGMLGYLIGWYITRRKFRKSIEKLNRETKRQLANFIIASRDRD